jgi:hypothetical protein
VLIGWDAGFQYYLGLSLMLPFLIQPTHLHLKIVFACLAAFTFIYSDLYWRKAMPIHSLAPTVLNMLGIINRIHISEATRRYLGPEFLVAERGMIAVKGKGDMQSYSLECGTDPRASNQAG